MKETILVAWIGHTDLKAAQDQLKGQLGPIGQAVKERSYSKVVLISDHPPELDRIYGTWLKKISGIIPEVKAVHLSSPMSFGEVYERADAVLKEVENRFKGGQASFTYHLSPGTPAMAAIWLLLAKTSHPAELIESSKEHGVNTVDLPFDLSVFYRSPLERFSQGETPPMPEFAHIKYECEKMAFVVDQAKRMALYDQPVLILGESGTGKELFARAIHFSSKRKEKPFVAVNCGAIPGELFEAELFGHEQGAFTGAIRRRDGKFMQAEDGTLFLDEIGELPLVMQTKLLRVLQERQYSRVGGDEVLKANVNIITATNRNLLKEVAENRFREDLFYRLAICVLEIPPLRERDADLPALIDHVLKQINNECRAVSGWKHKKISENAKNILLRHDWPGNIRELINTLTRAAILAKESSIASEDVQRAILKMSDNREKGKRLSLGDKGFTLPDLISELTREHLKKALEQSGGNKARAAKMLGLKNYQTLSNWIKKYGVDG